MSEWLREATQLGCDIDEHFGDLFCFTPMRVPDGADANAAPSRDPARPLLSFVATLVEAPAKPESPNAFDPRTAKRPQIESTAPYIEISPGVAAGLTGADGAPVFVGKGDLMRREKDGATYRVLSRHVTTSDVVVLKVNRIR
jgi:hypothetical protein